MSLSVPGDVSVVFAGRFCPPPCSQKLEKISKLDLALFFLGMDHWHFKYIHTVHVATQEKHIRLK